MEPESPEPPWEELSAERLSGMRGWRLQHPKAILAEIEWFRREDIQRFIRYFTVGVSGLLVNSLLLMFATEVLGLYYLVSALIATQGSTIWNFALTESWVFSARQQRQGRKLRLVTFLAVSNMALLLRGPMLFLFTSLLGIHYLVSNLISLGALLVVRYIVADNLIWGHTKASKRSREDKDLDGTRTTDGTNR